MKVQLFVSKDLEEAHAEIYTDVITDNIQKATPQQIPRAQRKSIEKLLEINTEGQGISTRNFNYFSYH